MTQPRTHRHWHEEEPETSPSLQARVAAGKAAPGLVAWVPTGRLDTSAMTRVPRYPASTLADLPVELHLDAARGSRVPVQIALLSDVRLIALAAAVVAPHLNGRQLAVEVAFVRYSPLTWVAGERGWLQLAETVLISDVSGDRVPDLIADALIPATRLDVPALAAQPVWLTVSVPADVPAGSYRGALRLTAQDGVILERPLVVDVMELSVPVDAEKRFHLDLWFAPDAVATAHSVEPWSETHWFLLSAYLREQAAGGQRVIGAAVVDDPWRHGFAYTGGTSQTFTPHSGTVAWSFDGTAWSFDFARFDRLVSTAIAAGVTSQITAYSMLAFSGPERLVYRDVATDELRDDEVVLGDDRWTAAWTAFLQAFEVHLKAQGWLERTFLAFDERPPAQLQPALDLVANVAPTFSARLHMAGTNEIVTMGQNSCVAWNDLAKVPADLLSRRRAAGHTTTFYTYCVGEHPNCVTFSPAVESRMIPWLAAKHGLDGYLRWAFNDWPQDVWCKPAHLFPQGDEYLVYPGPDGPLSSMRWELLRQGIEDVELLWAAQRQLGDDVPALRQALELATRNVDGRYKDPADLVTARRIVEEAMLQG